MLKFQAVAEKAAKNFRGLLFFAAPCTLQWMESAAVSTISTHHNTVLITTYSNIMDEKNMPLYYPKMGVFSSKFSVFRQKFYSKIFQQPKIWGPGHDDADKII